MKEMKLFNLAWPLFIETALFMLLGVIDVFILSGYDDLAASAVSTANQAVSIVTIVFTVISSATAVMISQYLGANKRTDASQVAALSIIALFTCSVSFNNVLLGLNRTKTLFIISDKWSEFANEVMSTVHRGITYIPARGAYTNAEREIVYILAKTVEVATIRRIVLTHDPQAIISVIDTKEVVGRGFTANN